MAERERKGGGEEQRWGRESSAQAEGKSVERASRGGRERESGGGVDEQRWDQGLREQAEVTESESGGGVEGHHRGPASNGRQNLPVGQHHTGLSPQSVFTTSNSASYAARPTLLCESKRNRHTRARHTAIAPLLLPLMWLAFPLLMMMNGGRGAAPVVVMVARAEDRVGSGGSRCRHVMSSNWKWCAVCGLMPVSSTDTRFSS